MFESYHLWSDSKSEWLVVTLGRHHKVCWWRRFLLLLQTELRHFTKRSFPHVAKTTKDHIDWLPLYWTPGFNVYIRRRGEYWLNGIDISNGHFVWIHKPFVFTSKTSCEWDIAYVQLGLRKSFKMCVLTCTCTTDINTNKIYKNYYIYSFI